MTAPRITTATVARYYRDRAVLLDGVFVGLLVRQRDGYFHFAAFCQPSGMDGEVAQYGQECTKRDRMLTYLEERADDLAARILAMTRWNATADPADHRGRWGEINRIFEPTIKKVASRITARMAATRSQP